MRARGSRIPARTQVIASSVVGLVVGAIVALLTASELAILVGWDVAVAVYMVWVWVTIWPLGPEHTGRLAAREDPTRAATDILLLSAAVASLVAVGFVLGGAAGTTGAKQLLRLILGLGSVVLSWGVVHTVFTLRYAQLYYKGPDGGVDFNQRPPPAYGDFAYLAFTIGMTFQVSDTDLRTAEIRRTALRHALLSYVFGTGIVATTINLIVNLTSK
jgi:uncharacterized membrane protein